MTKELYTKATKLIFTIDRLELLLEKLSNECPTLSDQDSIGKTLVEIYKADPNIKEGINRLLTDLLKNTKSDFKAL